MRQGKSAVWIIWSSSLTSSAIGLFAASVQAGRESQFISETALVGEVEQVSGHAVQRQNKPRDAEDYFRSAISFFASQNFEAAISDLDRALEMRPGEPKYLVLRARALLRNRQIDAGKADLDEAIAKHPNDVDALLIRASLLIAMEHGLSDRANTDLIAAKRELSNSDDRRISLADIYMSLRDWRSAVEQINLWIATHPKDYRRAEMFAKVCGARALLRDELSNALDDCNEALSLKPGDGTILASRAMINLRMQRLDAAINDYNAAIKIKIGDSGWLFFGRGLAKIRKGLEAEGRADIAASLAINKQFPKFAYTIGLIQSISDIR